jgi:polyhydroxyalkanoate synthesis regulator phasin
MDIKTDVQGIFRTEKGYLINKDNESLQNYRANKMRMVKMNSISERVDNLEQQISEIKELLIKALNK